MADTNNLLSTLSKNSASILKVAGVATLTLFLNSLLFRRKIHKGEHLSPTLIREEIQKEKKQESGQKVAQPTHVHKKQEYWGSFLISEFDASDDLLRELEMMDRLLFEVSRINNLIVDLGFENFETVPCPLVCRDLRRQKDEPFLHPEALVAPGEFVIKQCVFRPGKALELEKKYLRAGPRNRQFFDPRDVRADVVCLGKVCPGLNTVIREIVLILKNVYKVRSVTGVQHSFKGYYDNLFVDLTPKLVEIVHHQGGCFLGLCRTDLQVHKIVESLVRRNINQVYLIGANATLKAAQKIYQEIKKRKLPIAITVLLKGIHRDIPIFDTCFGYETAVEESSKILEKAYEHSHSNYNGVSLVKLPGYKSGFLAANTVLSTINANFCLVPEFAFDMLGPKGLLNAICERVKQKKSCTIVYSEGAENSVRDCCVKKDSKGKLSFDQMLQEAIQDTLKSEGLEPYHVALFDGIEISRSSAANSIDTKLCCQIAMSSIQGVMCGYTNFATGHLANKNGLISVDEMVTSQVETNLLDHQEVWQRVRMATGQSSLLNE